MITPNYSAELEQRVLETLMHYGNSSEARVQKAMLSLTTDSFYRMENQAIFAMIRKAYSNAEPFTFVDIVTSIPKDENDLYMAVWALIQEYGKLPSGESYLANDVSRLNTMMRLRKQMALAQNMIQDVADCRKPEEATAILTSAITEISGLNYRESKSGMSNADIADAFYEGKNVQPKPIATTCQQLNHGLGGGVMPKSLIFAAAAPSTGKTGFAIFLADAIARAQPDTEALFFSLEMEYNQIWSRHVGVCGGKPFDKMTEEEQLTAISKSLAIPLRIYDTTMSRNGADLDFIITSSRIRAMERKISVIVVDYLGLVKVKGKFDRNDLKLDEITTQLAQLAIELDCTVILLSQINRGAANRSEEDRCPWPHDAANGSGGHNSSAIWLGLDRPELYRDDPVLRNQFVVKCRKNRFGDIFELIFAFNGGTFAEVPYGWFKQPLARNKNAQESVFSARSNDLYNN